jgi:hypothetical protein
MPVSKVENSAQVWSCLLEFANGTTRFFTLFIDYRGRHCEGTAICNYYEVNLQPKLGCECKCIAKHNRMVENILNPLKWHYFCF